MLARGDGFSIPLDTTSVPALGTVSTGATGQSYEQDAVSIQVADYYLVAQAYAGQHTVTHKLASASTRKLKVPDACIGLGIECVTPFEMLKKERARFVLSP